MMTINVLVIVCFQMNSCVTPLSWIISNQIPNTFLINTIVIVCITML